VFVPEGAKADKGPYKVLETQQADEETRGAEALLLSSTRDPRPNANPKLDSFEAVMEAMDAQLQSLQQGASDGSSSITQPSGGKAKGKGRAPPTSDDLDIEAAMEAELKASLNEDAGDSEEEENISLDYNLMKNFLESFKSQAGLPGPVSNLAGRLMPDWRLPRDNV